VINGNGNPPPFVAITETWLKSYITDSQVAIENYCVYRSDRPKRTGGGCLLYINSKIVVIDTHTYEDKYNNLVMCSLLWSIDLQTLLFLLSKTSSPQCKIK
jgi:hypothetical protein